MKKQIFISAAALILALWGLPPAEASGTAESNIVSSGNAEPHEKEEAGMTKTEISSNRPLAIVRRFNPLVVVRHPDNAEWINAERTHPLHDADTLRTGDEGFAVVQFMDNSVARVRPNSLLIVSGEVRAPDNTSSRISVEVGDMFLNIRGANSSYEVATPSAVAAVRGTEFSTFVDPSGQSDFTGFSGEVEITALSSGQLATLTRGQRASVDAEGEEITIAEVSDEDLDSHYAEYESMDDEPDIRIMRLRFLNEDGEVEEIEIEYFETDSGDE